MFLSWFANACNYTGRDLNLLVRSRGGASMAQLWGLFRTGYGVCARHRCLACEELARVLYISTLHEAMITRSRLRFNGASS